jgi:hypothetical protein
MLKKIFWIGLALVLASNLLMIAQNTESNSTNNTENNISSDSSDKKCFIGSTLFLLGNFDKVNNPEYIQINVGFRISDSDVISLRFKRSIYSWPIGIPFGPSFDAPGENYPGHARILAPTLGYQRFWWKGVYTAIYAMNAFEKYMDKNNNTIGNGFTLYLDFYLGYQFKFFDNRFFFEPAIGISYWPIRTNVPDSFKAVEKKWPNYFIQPGLDFGFYF